MKAIRFGAEVTGVCSAANAEMVASIGPTRSSTVPEAVRYPETGHAREKVVITV